MRLRTWVPPAFQQHEPDRGRKASPRYHRPGAGCKARKKRADAWNGGVSPPPASRHLRRNWVLTAQPRTTVAGVRVNADGGGTPPLQALHQHSSGDITVPTSWGDGGRGRRSGPRSLGQSHCSIPTSAERALHSCAISPVMRSRQHKLKFTPRPAMGCPRLFSSRGLYGDDCGDKGSLAAIG